MRIFDLREKHGAHEDPPVLLNLRNAGSPSDLCFHPARPTCFALGELKRQTAAGLHAQSGPLHARLGPSGAPQLADRGQPLQPLPLSIDSIDSTDRGGHYSVRKCSAHQTCAAMRTRAEAALQATGSAARVPFLSQSQKTT